MIFFVSIIHPSDEREREREIKKEGDNLSTSFSYWKQKIIFLPMCAENSVEHSLVLMLHYVVIAE